MTPAERPPAVVCGTGFGRVYLEALSRPDSPYRPAGVLARGSARSVACAEHYGVPLYRDVDEVPDDVALACVVVGSGLVGGPGATLAERFLTRGVPVLQEHPLHPDELASCLRVARRHGTVHHVDTLFVHVEPVRRFVAAARRLLTRQPALFVEATCAYQVLQTLLEVLGEALGGARATGLTAAPGEPGPFRTVSGELAGVPFALRVQHELDPRAPDNHAHLLHRVTIGTEGGQLTLVNTHGPVVWTPRAHMPTDLATAVRLGDSAATHLDLPSARVVGPAEAPSYRHALAELWPNGILRAITALRHDVVAGDGGRAHGQRQLLLSRLSRKVNELLGPVRLIHRPDPEVLDVDDVLAGTEPTTGAR
ncbi:Gfo/Idh/MocA family oxidoreductase [Saccharomonospora cyanea]|uniref:Thiazolinyl imide reductase n=1 Tax=Saccharomonospora cyanea NA-134 TaxID=882082 RepID=H5XHL2_9PSEU|nr:Gfo/Idh/MocA family oxidoreductase [Saccharomonospora cyanea]EHR61692.1 thiazolinyl imide reductase [Saccharomonospora cyanea NA-134]